MESIGATERGVYARDQWGRVWEFSGLTQTWALLPPPAGTAWVEVPAEWLVAQAR